MSESYGPVSTSPDAPDCGGAPRVSTSTDATDVKDTAKAEAGRVVDTAKAEAGSVASEAKSQAQDAVRTDQGRACATRPASSSSVPPRVCVRQATSCVAGVGHRRRRIPARDGPRPAGIHPRERRRVVARDRDPESLLNEVKSYARRRPGMFIGIALVAGVVAGRLTRALAEGSADRKAESRDRLSPHRHGHGRL